jgi:hypothetical protein
MEKIIFYILIAIVYLVYSQYRKMHAKRGGDINDNNTGKSSLPENEDYSFIEELIAPGKNKSLTQENEAPVKRSFTPKSVNPEHFKTSKYEMKPAVSLEIPLEEIHAERKNKMNKPDIPDVIANEETKVYGDIFDLKQAIIYSEILKRPDY